MYVKISFIKHGFYLRNTLFVPEINDFLFVKI